MDTEAKEADLLDINDVVLLLQEKKNYFHVLQGEINMLEHLKTTLEKRGSSITNKPDHGSITTTT